VQALRPEPVSGVSLQGISLLRLDQSADLAPGNKRYKLEGYLAQARHQGVKRLLSFGGAWSNHLHALAAVGADQGFETVGLVRGEAHELNSPTLQDARRWGMRIVAVDRSQFRLRNDPLFQQQLATQYSPCLLIPEGGAGACGVRGCVAIADTIRSCGRGARHIVVPVGTGTTMAGVVAGLDDTFEVLGIACMKGVLDLEDRVAGLLDVMGPCNHARWRIDHTHHCGGFARVSPSLRAFMLDFEAVQGVPLDPVYTGKMMLALHAACERSEHRGRSTTLAIHTGGLQGRRGYDWLGGMG